MSCLFPAFALTLPEAAAMVPATIRTVRGKRLAGDLRDRACVVTGAAGSLGLACVDAFLREGASVLLVDRDADALAAAAATLDDRDDSHAGRIAIVAADVADARETEAFLAEAVRRFGRLDVIVCNAGISGAIAPAQDYPEDVFDRVLAVNLKAPFLACKYGLPLMSDGGAIVMTASVVSVTSDPGIAAYAASKHGLIGLMRTVAKEAAPRRIRVNAVAPGPIDNGFQRDVETGLTKAIGRPAGAFLDGLIPMGRHGAANEVAEAILYLASDRASFTTGSVLMVDGGMHV